MTNFSIGDRVKYLPPNLSVRHTGTVADFWRNPLASRNEEKAPYAIVMNDDSQGTLYILPVSELVSCRTFLDSAVASSLRNGVPHIDFHGLSKALEEHKERLYEVLDNATYYGNAAHAVQVFTEYLLKGYDHE
jgi:hypothetical protein